MILLHNSTAVYSQVLFIVATAVFNHDHDHNHHTVINHDHMHQTST